MIVSKTDTEHERQAIGRRLKEAREQREITLEQISQASKFRVEQLKAVERGDFEALPHVLWARGILITYGNYVGLDGAGLAQRLFPMPRTLEAKRYLMYRWRMLAIVTSVVIASAASLVVATIFAPYNPVTGRLAELLDEAFPGTFLGSETQRVAIFGYTFGYTGGTIDGMDNVLVAEVAEEGLGLHSVSGDTPAQIPGYGRGDVGDVLAMDRPDLVRQTISGLTDVQVQYYVVVSTDGVREIVGSRGGVMVDVPRPVGDRASPGGTAITLTPGLQKLDGDQAIVYLQGGDLQTDAEIARR